MRRCIDPVLCYDAGTSKKFRHYSLSTPFFKLLHNKVFDCGQCVFCRKKRATELAVRCVLHASLYKDNCFLTLTYDEKKPEYHNRFQYKDIQDFKKRLRSDCAYHEKKRIQIFNVHEYGKNGKKHWHLVVFNHNFNDRRLHTTSNGLPLYTSKELETLWPYGFNTIGNVSEASAMYQAQYTQKDLLNGNMRNEKKSHSKHAGIGREFFLLHYRQILGLGYIPFQSRKIPIPRYFLKLAHKHYCHFHEQHYFFDNKLRKRLYSPFKPKEQPLEEISDLYILNRERKQEHIMELIKEWDLFIGENTFSPDAPDFAISGANYLYDLQNKRNITNF